MGGACLSSFCSDLPIFVIHSTGPGAFHMLSPAGRFVDFDACTRETTSKDNNLASGGRAGSAGQMPRRRFGEMALIEITIGAVDSRAKSGLCEVLRDVLASWRLLRYTPFGLLDTLFLCRVAHPLLTESIHQLTIGWVKLQGTKPGLSGF